MADPDPLFSLIQSMSMQEKRHFKLFMARYAQGSNKSLELFDAVAAQPVPDRKRFKEKHADKRFMNYLPAEKNYLEGLLRRSLRLYHSGAGVDIRLKELLTDAEILLEKKLLAHSRKILSKARKLAYRYERFTFIPEIVRLESRLYELDKLDEVYAEERAALEKLHTISRYRSLSNRVARFVARTHQLRSKKELREFETLMNDPLLSDESKADSFTAKVYFFYIKGVCFELKGDLKSGYEYRKRFVQRMEEHPGQLEIHARNYMAALNNLAISQLELKKFSEAKISIQRLKTLPGALGSSKNEILVDSFVFSALNELSLHIRTGTFSEGLEAARQAEKQLEKFRDKIHPQFSLVLCNSIKYVYFGAGEFRKALKWSARVLQEESPELRKDIQAMARIFNLVLHLELGNTDLLEHILKSTYRYLYKRERLYAVESIVLRRLRRTPDPSRPQEQLRYWKELRRELSPLAADPFEKKAFEEFDLIAWLDSKIEKISFAEAVKRSLMQGVTGSGSWRGQLAAVRSRS